MTREYLESNTQPVGLLPSICLVANRNNYIWREEIVSTEAKEKEKKEKQWTIQKDRKEEITLYLENFA